MLFSFQTNAILFWPQQNVHERVLYIDSDNRYVALIDIFSNDALPVVRSMDEIQNAMHQERLIKIPNDPYSYLSELGDNLSNEVAEELESIWAKIKELVTNEPAIYASQSRGSLIKDAMAEHKLNKKSVYKWLRRYWQRGKTKNGLLPDFWKCGGPGVPKTPSGNVRLGRKPQITSEYPDQGGVNVTEDLKQVFRIAIQQFYNKRVGRSLTKTYELMCEKILHVETHRVNGIPVPVTAHAATVPTFRQFEYFYQKHRDLEAELKSREGERRFNLQHRPILGESKHMAFGPGSLYQIDATIGDVYLNSALNASKIIGRPVIYTVKDVFSSMIAGLYVGLEGPSWVGAMMALANATTDKVAFCAEHGVEITPEDWPCVYLPVSILADRGEMLSDKADQVVKNLNIRIDNTPPYRADWKAIIEQHFRLANLEVINWVPGAVNKRMQERGERDYRLDAVFTLQEFTSLLIKFTLFHNNHHHRMNWYRRDEFQIMDDVEPVPINLWRWGIANRSGFLREWDPDIIKLNLLPRTEASVTREGIRINGLYYTCDRAIAEQWITKARYSHRWKVEAAYDPRRPGVAYLCRGNASHGSPIEPCRLLPKDERFAGFWLEEYEEFTALDKISSTLAQTDERQAHAEMDAQIEHATKQAKKRQEAAAAANPISNAQKVGGIRANRAEEKERIRQRETWDKLGQDQPLLPSEASADVIPAPTSDVTQTPSMESPTATTPETAPVVPFNRKRKLLSILSGDDDEKV